MQLQGRQSVRFHPDHNRTAHPLFRPLCTPEGPLDSDNKQSRDAGSECRSVEICPASLISLLFFPRLGKRAEADAD